MLILEKFLKNSRKNCKLFGFSLDVVSNTNQKNIVTSLKNQRS